MVECKDFCKGIIQLQWEHKKLQMQMEDLNNKCRDIRQLKLTEEQRDVSPISFLRNPDVVLERLSQVPLRILLRSRNM